MLAESYHDWWSLAGVDVLVGEAPEGMQLAGPRLGGIFNMGGVAVANYCSILERLK